MSQPLYGTIEAGGTKFNCAVGTGPSDLRATVRIATTTPSETIEACLAFFQRQQSALGPLAAVGIASFGPLDLNPDSPTFGSITKTPKSGWSNVPLVQPIADRLGVPVSLDTDVNGAALSEGRWGAARGLQNFLYLTVGTGIGGGAVVNGRLIHGLIHPEMGHIRLTRHPADAYPGACSFHGECLEGLASGPALKGRWGQEATELPIDHPAWAMEASYIAQALVNFTCVLSPERIVVGGGVFQQQRLFPMVRKRVLELFNGYIDSPVLTQDINTFIVPPGLGDRAGILGGIALAEVAAGQ